MNFIQRPQINWANLNQSLLQSMIPKTRTNPNFEIFSPNSTLGHQDNDKLISFLQCPSHFDPNASNSCKKSSKFDLQFSASVCKYLDCAINFCSQFTRIYNSYHQKPLKGRFQVAGTWLFLLLIVSVAMGTLVLKSARRTEANRVPKRKARGEGALLRIMEAQLYANFFKDHSHSIKHIFHKQVR